ncbi:hypothetical protein [Candidatus Villigracilis affinis]|uniref:hypothetical protein n=1 Tax=Candidatus Villigracilis affinis TaxID=3140682 RepID=UPI0031EDB2F6
MIDPAPSVARQVKRLLGAEGTKSLSQGQASVRFSSGDVESMKSMVPVLLGETGDVELAVWKTDTEVF